MAAGERSPVLRHIAEYIVHGALISLNSFRPGFSCIKTCFKHLSMLCITVKVKYSITKKVCVCRETRSRALESY